MFRINQQVVCVDDCPGHVNGIKTLNKDSIYTISDVHTGYPQNWNGDVKVHGIMYWHNKERFRPLSDVLAEISIAELVEEVVEC